MVHIDYIIIFVSLKYKRYIFCYCIFHYDDNHIIDICVSYMSLIVIFDRIFESVMGCHFCHNCFGAVIKLYKVPFKHF